MLLDVMILIDFQAAFRFNGCKTHTKTNYIAKLIFNALQLIFRVKIYHIKYLSFKELHIDSVLAGIVQLLVFSLPRGPFSCGPFSRVTFPRVKFSQIRFPRVIFRRIEK
jgi:hypothetical protein